MLCPKCQGETYPIYFGDDRERRRCIKCDLIFEAKNKTMSKTEIIEGLESLVRDRESMIDPNDTDCIFSYDKKVLEAAIEELTKQ